MSLAKKTLAFIVTAVMAFTMMAATAFADDTYTITGPKNGHTYNVYQIFTGDLNDGVLSNVKWGANGTGTAGTAVDDTTLSAIAALDNKTQATANAVSAYVNFKSDATAVLTNDNATATVAAGYYLVKDMGPAASGESLSTYIVSVVGDLTITPKTGTVDFQKKIKDTNDTTGDTSDWQDSADYDINDHVPFQLTGKVASNYADYEQYYFQFRDSMEKSLTFDGVSSVKVYVDGVQITEGYTIETGNVTDEGKLDGDSFTVTFANLKNVNSVHAGSTITVEYTATLNENAVLGNQGNVNEAKLRYSNNPNDSQGGSTSPTDDTPWDNVIVFTYKVVIDKVDSSNQPLTGAEFTLSKKMQDGSTKAITTVKNAAGTEFTFSGLDDGSYVLSETKTPAGYNTISDIEFTVAADHTITWNGESRDTILKSLSGNKVSGEITFTPKLSDGSLTANVVNKKGAELPSTGGMGTTIFYIVGGILVAGAVVLLVSRKRTNSIQE